MSDVAYVSSLPNCDFCGITAKYDAATIQGCWANMCEKCNKLYGKGKLGTGYGQELRLVSEKPDPILRDAEDLDMDEIEEMILGESNASTSCPEGCEVEVDGTCPHGYSSHLLELGFV